MTIAPRDLKKHFSNGGKAINGWCAIPSTVTAEITARQGFDIVSVDLQHGLVDYQSALEMLQVISGFGMPTLCRVPWNEPGIIMKALDAGFTGVICPMINTVDEAKRLVDACRYMPRGSRSFGPTRAMQVYGPDYAKTAHEFICVIAMIETAEAMTNLSKILEVDGIDGVYVGPADLGLSMGHEPVLLPTSKAVFEAIATICKTTKATGKFAGIHCGSPEMIRQMLDDGFDFATLITDVRMFTTIVSSQLAAARNVKAAVAKGQY
jgi:4-hydroxy-2-oxoheptanedioate aldolase